MEMFIALKDLFLGHKWVILAAVVVGLLVRLTKSDVPGFPTVPSRWRPSLAVGLSLAGGVLVSMLAPDDAIRAQWLVDSIIAGMLAIASHGVLIRGVRDGKEIGEKQDEVVR